MVKRIVSRPAVAFALLAILAFPITELLLFREAATHFVHDVLDNQVPVFTALADDIARGHLSLWNPDLTTGNPRLSQMPLPPTMPEVWLGIALAAFDAYLLGYALLIWVAGYGMHRFLRDAVGLPAAGSVVGGAFFAFSFWHYVMGFSIALLPLLLWLTDRFLRADGDRRLLGAALTTFTAAALWVGHPQLFEFAALVQLGYVIVVAGPRRTLQRDLSAWLATWVIAALVFAPSLLTQLTHLGDSQRATWDLNYLFSGQPAARGIAALEAYRLVAVGVPIGEPSSTTAGTYGTWFAGAIGLPLLLLSLVVPRPDPRARYLLAVLLAIPILDLVATVAAPYMDALGPVGSFQLIRVRHLVPFAVAANIAIGLAALLRGRDALPPWPLTASAVAIGVGLVAIQLAVALGQPLDLASSAGWVAAVAALGLGLAAVAILVARTAAAPAIRTALLVAVILLTIGERAAFARAERLLAGNGLGTWAEMMTVDPARSFIRERAGPTDRVLTVGLPVNRAHPNAMALAGLHDAGGYETTYPLTYHAFFGLLTDPFLDTNPALSAYFDGWGNRAYAFGPGLDPELLDLAGVRWIYARGTTVEMPGIEGRYQWRDVTVYENVHPLPRAAIVHATRTFASVESLNGALADASVADLEATAYALESDLPSGFELADKDATAGPATITGYDDDLVTVRANAAAPALLVLTDVWDAGWTATVDGQPAEIVRLYGTFRGVRVPAGTSEVSFSYRPMETYAGLALGGATALGLLVWTAVAIRDRRRRSAGP